jgi:hypothetical protein
MSTNRSIFLSLSLIISLISLTAHGQEKEPNFWDDVMFGGNVGANFGNNFTSVIVAPQAIYKVQDNLGIGLGLNYSYSRLNTGDPRILDNSSNILGGGVIGIFNPIDFLQASFDFEMLNVNRNFDNARLDDNYWVPALFLGAGYRQGNFVIGARYDVLYDRDRSVYNNGLQPFVRVLF